ncbi:MAG TPA: alpha,alpha-trehalase TreF [Nevskiaceae bacterium]|nr:alpha,alpha-trehalase TreF [Nevskiaceae bacterium]
MTDRRTDDRQVHEFPRGAEWATQTLPRAETLTPNKRYQELFVAVQMERVYPDGKIFVDCSPNRDPEDILADYRRRRSEPGFDLKAFVHANFTPQHPDPRSYLAPEGRPLKEHIDKLWDVLSRAPDDHPASSSLLPLPRRYVVPGGRFCEIYYWDTYFTMLGLAASGRRDLMRGMADNFAYLIETWGHIPNGNRTYYLPRSQPPLFAFIVELFERHNICRALSYLPMLHKEHDYWMADADSVEAGEAHGPVVRFKDGTLLNRYWDWLDTARPQSYREDVLLAQRSGRPPHEIWRNTRAGAACGWDFSSRWFDDPQDMATIRTTEILPVDLNCFLYRLESVIAELSQRDDDPVSAKRFHAAANARAQAINRVFWNAEHKTYMDYDWARQCPRPRINAATATPLFAGLASAQQAHAVAQALRNELLETGGLATTTIKNGQQWDQPNGWAPLQWIAIQGLKRYHEDALADTIATRWLTTVATVYRQSSKCVEKYDLHNAQAGGGGEYAGQDGFGWTNGVTRALMDLYPDHPAAGACAGQ